MGEQVSSIMEKEVSLQCITEQMGSGKETESETSFLYSLAVKDERELV